MNVLKKHLISRVLSIALSVLMALTNPMAAYAAEDGYVPEDEYAEQIEQLRSEVTFVIEDENPDKNVSTIPEDEELPKGGSNEEVDKPPKIEDSPGDTDTPNPNGDGEPIISPEVTPEITPEVTPSEDPDPPTPTEEVKEPEPTEEPSPTPIVLIEFDHYYSEITESAVNTPELMIKTSNPDVFTKNTNVISNYDDVYIIECASVQEARYVYSYYINKVDFISDLSEVMTLASDGEEKHEDDVADLENLNESEDAISQLNEIVPEVQKVDYSDYIALIDTGANADVNFSVVGENTDDDNGHGTKMLELIKSANPNAKVMSIKVFNGSTTTVADVYAGIKLAIESEVKVINLSLVGANIQKNAILKEIIQEALNKGIIVIGAAGNNNTNAKNYIPGCIDGVIVVGAVNEDGTKYSTSNYNASVYVVATSTSEATAIYTGLYTANHLDDGRIFATLKDPNENPPIDEPIEIPSDTHDDKKAV